MAAPPPAPANSLYWRQFVRSSEPDLDWPVDSAWVADHISANDQFGNRLLQSKTSDILTLNQVVAPYYQAFQNSKAGFNTYSVADGGFMKYDPANDAWFNPHLRFLCIAYPGSQVFAATDWAVFIVGSWETDSEDRFVQVASWDGVKFSYYGRDRINPGSGINPVNGLIGWVYQGNSFDAFKDSTSYLGPFNGHVNGVTIMKELRKPWLHWHSTDNNGSISQCFSGAVLQQLQKTTFVSVNEKGSLVNVTSADVLELTVESAVNKWMQSRKVNDFWTNGNLSSQVNIQRWIAHVLLTTTVNIRCAETTNDTQLAIMSEFFINHDMLSVVSLGQSVKSTINVPISDYEAAVTAMDLSMIQEIGPADDPPSITIYNNLPPDKRVTLYQGSLGGGKQTDEHNVTLYAIAEQGEGFGPFTCLTASVEDLTGVKWLQNHIGDPWNPVYSWRRGVLMQYCPATTTLAGKTYDVDQVLVTNITQSSFAKIEGSPEFVFTNWYNGYDTNKMENAINTYITAINNRIKKSSTKAVSDWMLLAESQRRIYRPLPLDEFGFTLPFALKYPNTTDLMPYEMLQDANIAPIPQRGLQFLSDWSGTLWTDNPILLPIAKNPSTIMSVMDQSSAPTAGWTLPGKGKALASCEGPGNAKSDARPRACPVRSTRVKRTAGVDQTCPVMVKPRPGLTATAQTSTVVASSSLTEIVSDSNVSVVTAPVWSDILKLLQDPYWVPNGVEVGKGWQGAMKYYGNYTAAGREFDIWDEGIVRDNIKNIYDHLRGRSMPVTNNLQEYWPDEALEMLRSWANNGFRTNESDPFNPRIFIPLPSDSRPVYRLRKDVRSMTQEEINIFRAKLDDVLGCTVLNSKWQELNKLHAQWCLHYQEAFSLWHRAYLRYVEDLIDFAIPYWNTCDPACADPSSPAAGLPQAFLDETYQHPISHEIRPNPLRYALALDGISTSGKGSYITRDTTLMMNDRTSDAFKQNVASWTFYQDQYEHALSQTLFSYPQNVTTGAGSPFGLPWANPLTFSDHQPDDLYKYSNKAFPYTPNFDGFFEQVHDNGHGWVGGPNGDMSDNGRTAADPIFLVYHANIDRILDAYLSTHPQTMYTANYPLRPFVNNASGIDYDDPRTYMFTTIGDMAKDTRSIGYIYAPPFANNGNDILTAYVAAQGGKQKPQVSGGTAVQAHSSVAGGTAPSTPKSATTTLEKPKLQYQYQPMISFPNIKCTTDSYTIDLFTKDAQSLAPDHLSNKDYLGRLTRLGMGLGNDDNASSNTFKRCRRSPITRSVLLDAPSTGLGEKDALVDKVATNGFQQVVTNLRTGEEVPRVEWERMDGFTGYFGVGYQPAV